MVNVSVNLSKSMRLLVLRLYVLMTCLLLACFFGNAPVVLASDGVKTHALLINGGGSRRINYQSHLLHVKRLHRLLSEAGIPGNQISILSADGSNPDTDLATREMQMEADFWMLDGTRLKARLRPQITYTNSEIQGASLQAATRENLRQWFEGAATSLGSGDTLLVYVTDHGNLNEDNPSNNQIILWGEEEYINVDELRELINKLQPSVRVLILMSQCFSGSFANLIYGQASAEIPRVNLGGFFSSTADRPAYGCYPENREEYQVGHSFRFFDALESLGSFSDAHQRVLVTDRTPDVPLRASDFYLETLLEARAESLGKELDELVDQLLQEAWRDRKAWEAEIRLMDRMGEAFGYFSPRFLSELALHSDALSALSEQLDDYATAWKRTQHSLNGENLDRFLDSNPQWASRLEADTLKALLEDQRSDLARELLIELAAYTKNNFAAHSRMKLLREKAEATRKARYRAQVREGVVLRMRIMLISIAGRQYLSGSGSEVQREAYSNLLEHESFVLGGADDSRDHQLDIEPFPPFEDEIKITDSALPGWMGIMFRPVSAEKRNKYQLDGGAVSVLAVYPDSPAQNAGLETGDVIIGLPGQPFTERNFVREWVMTAPIGEAHSMQVLRGENLKTLTLTPEPYPREWPSLPGPPQVGSPAPLIGSLETFRGKPVGELTRQGPYLLFFWATWCGPCKAALPELMAFERELMVPVVSITDEMAETVESFLQKHKGLFPEAIILDESRRSFLAYGVSGTPRFVLVDEKGIIKSSNSGYRASSGLQIENWNWDKAPTAKDD